MSNRIEYNGYMIEPQTRLSDDPQGWTLEVRISPLNGEAKARRCYAPNTYRSEERAVARCLEFGRQIVDGKIKPKADRAK